MGDRFTWRFRLTGGKEISPELVAICDGPAQQWDALDEIAKPAPDSRHWITKLPHGVIHARLTDILNDPHETIAQLQKHSRRSGCNSGRDAGARFAG